MPLAAVTVKDIVLLLILLVVANGVLLAPLVVAIIGAWGERFENRDHRPQV